MVGAMTLQTRTDLFIYGAGGFGREVAWLASTLNLGVDVWRVVAYLDDALGTRGERLHDVPVMVPEDAVRCYPQARAAIAVGNPRTRVTLAARLESLGVQFATLVHPETQSGPRIALGDGTLICAGNILTTDIRIGAHVHLNLDCTVGHDVIIADFVTIAPGVHISGNVTVHAGAEIGTGAMIRQGLTIGRGAAVGMGAVVTKDVPAGETWVGNPARRLR